MIKIELSKLISNCLYIDNCSSNKKKDINSLSFLIDKTLSQSDCIKLGIGCEKLINDIILKFSNYKNIKSKNVKGCKEKDHLYLDEENKIIYFAELKSNINLDTEKSQLTCQKCIDIVNEIEETYKDYKIMWCLVSLRYLKNNNIPKNISKKYNVIKDNLLDINEYFKLLDINLEFNEENYKKFLNEIVNKMFRINV